ncbi:hypothetical protein [Winogradskyella poriferorum]|uniref:hypothetical protein n=1 Tax=Winogradskyella poriferorum TaxID=307627 RepID=UPI003D64881E
MSDYRVRYINYYNTIEVNDWKIKTYTISKSETFHYPEFYKEVLKQIPEWIKSDNGFNNDNDGIGFLILHAGTEGIFSLINWWVGQNMLNTLIFKSDYDQLHNFELISGNGLAPCIWELEVINFERLAWTKHILKSSPNPNYKAYLETTFSGAF